MLGFSQSTATSFQNSQGNKRKWVSKEDDVLIACMVYLHNVGTFNADAGFNTDYLNELERMLEKVLPHVMLKARPNHESRIKILKKDWTILYNMLRGKDNSNFGWDKYRATEKDAQTTADIVEKIDAKDVATAKNPKGGSNYHG
ncbi:hypothetical protein CXB51_027831 [Gossypium anomalum]|uniref:Myb/SANT-like domain-containing protein n=1 Tax=Gossypium anomalum TaxID=47600 RepID=A0A8J5YDL8_9ROSI|nr:hypothetical protein CXB51_027831 [Gossypium anomalum]